jgi:hypothetical protein
LRPRDHYGVEARHIERLEARACVEGAGEREGAVGEPGIFSRFRQR